MRVANENGVDLVRKSSSKNPLSKYLIVAEGDNTEPLYFKGIDENRDEIGINSLIQICLVENEEEENGHSHPLKKLDNFEKSLNDEKIVYYPEIDKVCFLVDRDPQNFFPDQYEAFLKMVLERGYYVYISNPTFEIFLLMHDDRILEEDREKLLKNEFTTAGKNERLLEKKLREFFACKKNCLNFDKFKSNIDRAIKNEKNFEEDIRGLKEKLGSNVGKLIEDMRKNN